jgi:uncharacterized protein YecE (DUF72 family)
VLAGAASGKSPQIFVGSARWGEKSLLGKIYPPATPARDYLYHYSRQFNTVEMNTTHYRIPTPEMVVEWLEKVPDNFRFCPKLPQSISHQPDFGDSTHATDMFLESLQAFGHKLGLPFMQLPPTFKPHRDGKQLFDYLERWPEEIPLAVEFRHPDWFSQPRITERALVLLQQMGIATVITDTAGRRDVVHMQLTSGKLLVRFVGNSLHPTDYSRIDEWVGRIDKWLNAGLQELYFFVHQPEEHLCVDLAIYFIERMNRLPGIKLQAPRPVQIAQQQKLF